MGKECIIIDFIPVLDSLLKAKGITQKQFLLDNNLSQNVYTKWRQGQIPNAELFCQIADYLNVSVDFLAGRDRSISAEDVQLLQDFHSLNKEYQDIILNNIKSFKDLS